jgi:hypothetical protein
MGGDRTIISLASGAQRRQGLKDEGGPMFQQLFRSVRSLILAVVLLTLTAPNLLSPHSVSWADVGELPEPGGLVTPGDKTDEIRMKSESVLFSVQPNDGTFWESAECYAHVTARFVMQNLTARAVTMTLFFPLHSTLDPATFETAEKFRDSQARNVRVLVGGQEAAFTYQTLAASGEQLLSAVFEAAFPASADTPIHVEYDVRGVHEPKSSSVSFRYMMQTGSHWAGTIGSGRVAFQFWQEVDSKAAFDQVNSFLQAADGGLEWNIADLEPDAAHDIRVTFELAALANWAKRPSYVKDVVASGPAAGDIAASLVWPKGSALADLLDSSRRERGWVVQPGQDPGGEWIELVLDRPHTVMGLRIRTGVLDRVMDFETDQTLDVYDSFRRPKTVAIALSGAMTQTVSLADTPAEWQIVLLPASPTTSIRLTCLDSYPGTSRGDAYLGVGRIELLGVDAGIAGASPAGECNGPNLLRNGDFEQGFGGQGLGLGWKGFGSGEGDMYSFSADPWSPVVYQGLHSQLIAVNTYDVPPMADRSAGIYQRVTGLEAGAVYELSLAGLLREEAAHPGEDPNRYVVQWALVQGSPEWMQVAAWQDLPWDTYYLSTEPGTFSTYTTRLLGPGNSATLFIRAWKKWATSGRELDVNLDAITLLRCGPAPTAEP